jgi:hypothetical protein
MAVSALEVIPATDAARWHEVLSQTDGFDFYHLPEYHWVAEQNGEGRGVLFVYREASQVAAWPFLLRPVEMLAGLEQAGQGFHDATSVYGYPGPICSSGVRNDTAFIHRFNLALQGTFKELKLVSLFSRLHPLLENVALVTMGAVAGLGETVCIDLSLSPATQMACYRKSHRYEVRKARRQGMQVYQDQDWTHFDDFFQLYTVTMRKVDADERYYFDRRYFLRLREALGERLQLFVAQQDGIVCSAALFIHTGDIIQYHLAGSDPDYAKLAPSKLVLDEARLWGNSLGTHFLHLGGGVGSRKDSLFSFKAGFSPLRCKFFVWHYTVLPEMYSQLVDARRIWLAENGMSLASFLSGKASRGGSHATGSRAWEPGPLVSRQKLASTDFFPLYRAG